MTTEPLLTVNEETTLEQIVALMEKNGVKRVPVMREDKVVGIVTRSNLLQAVASLARDFPDPTADDDHIRNRVIDTLAKQDWCPFGLSVVVRDGIVHLSRRHHRGTLTEGHHCRHGKHHGSKEGSRPSVLGRHHVRNVSELSGGRGLRRGELIARPFPCCLCFDQRGTTAVASISTLAAFSTRRTT